MEGIKDTSVYILAIVCILAIVFIVFIVGNNAGTIATATSNSVGGAYSVVDSNIPADTASSGFSKTYTSTEPCAYAYLRDDSKC